MSTLFISDLHLHPARPAILACFARFLSTIPETAEALYVLGDLFESWVGDDHPEPAYAQVKRALRQCVHSGTPIFLLRGNRDFLLGDRFARETGCVLLDDPAPVDLYGRKSLLMHGDLLCTDDVDYQALRRRLRDPDWQRQALALPLEERLALAEQARELSVLAGQDKDAAIMDVNPDEVLRVFARYDVDLLIHGHTHRPGIHRLRQGDRDLERVVLGDWYEQGSVLRAAPGKLELETLGT
jgi:UDP-2,3-diacylglucosamine hydrolase